MKKGDFDAVLMDVQDCLNAGMNAHIAKPLDLTVLGKNIRDIVTLKKVCKSSIKVLDRKT